MSDHDERWRPGPGQGRAFRRPAWEPAEDFEQHRRHHDDDEEEEWHGPGPRMRHRRRVGPMQERVPPHLMGDFPAGRPFPPDFPPMLVHKLRGRARARRGDVRAAALALLADQEPRNGYQIIQAIGERSGGMWRASPGSVYPALQQLEDEGLVRAEAGDGGRRGYVLTDEGRAYVAAHPDELEGAWRGWGPHGAAFEMRELIGQLHMAAYQVMSAGTDAQQAQARKLLADTRKALYRILAADDEDASPQEAE
jgi:DNA-binding PadR family transcriptional regulator